MIIKLHQNLINKIAAGEVVERPASVLKELIENSIDAGADKINIEIKNSGIDLIKISDNGTGMSKEDALIACDSHTTSKLTTIEDLENIQTMGFRGEALASISSVSNFTIITNNNKNPQATKIRISFGKKEPTQSTASNQGTTISVENLFANIPARRKFLKSPSTELKHLLKVFENYALCYPHIQFSLKNNGKLIYNLTSTFKQSFNEELLERIKTVLGKNFSINLMSANFKSESIQISGFLGHPEKAISRRANQILFINKRPVFDPIISKAIQESFRTFIPHGNYPVYVLFIEIDPSKIDVNIHPRKQEVRFEEPNYIYRIIYNFARNLLSKNLKISAKESILSQSSNFRNSDFFQKRFTDNRNSFRPNKSEVKESLSFTKNLLETYRLSQNKIFSEDENFNFPVAQFFKEILVYEKDDKLIFLDQHAVSERINFDKLTKQINLKNIEKQRLLIPFEIDLSKSEIEKMNLSKNTINKTGISFELKGTKILITEIPTLLAKTDLKKLLNQILADIEDEQKTNSNLQNLIDKIIATMACHASIRGGDKLSQYEINDLINKFLKVKTPYSCPHGRPVLWEISKNELERKFKRP